MDGVIKGRKQSLLFEGYIGQRRFEEKQDRAGSGHHA